MSKIAGFVCWDRDAVLDTIATEAVSPSPSVFIATHAPLDIKRVAGGQPPREEIVTEGQLLRDFLERRPNKGVLVIPVIGESGSGKSHLVRWVQTKTTSTPKRRVIYLPKDSTSLAGVVDKLLIGLEGPPFDDIRRDIGRLGHDITQDTLERRLLDELAESLRRAEPATASERALVGQDGLHSLLHDPYFRQQLLREGSLIRRRAAHAISGKGSSDSDVPLQFTVADLPLDVTEVIRAAQASRRLFQALIANDRLQREAVDLLNRHLDVAVMQATNLGVGRLQQAFLEIRRALAGREEIVLLVEDFALVQGVQRDLLDAILETGEREGRTVLASIRTLLAVTTGYYHSLPDTVLTRVESSSPYRYELRVAWGVSSGARHDTEERVVDFIGRYLNAARVGRVELDRLDAPDQARVANKCDSCPVKDPCHRGFGTARTGHGLYPYNRAALLRAVRVTSPPDQADTFNPRAALARVVRHVLVEYQDAIRDGQFPDDRFQAEFPPTRDLSVLSPTVADQTMRADPATGMRRRVLLQYWGDAPLELRNVAPEIHDAFHLSQVTGVDEVVDTDDTDDTDGKEVRPPGQTPPRLRRRLDEVENWLGRGATFPTELANEIRRTVRSAVIIRITWTDPAMRPPSAALIDRAWPQGARTVSIEGAPEAIVGATPSIRFARTPENAHFFEDLIKLEGGIDEGTLRARLRLDRLAEVYGPVAKQAVLDHLGRTDDHLVVALRVSLVGSALCGRAVPGGAPAVLMNAALEDVGTLHRPDQAVCSPLWLRLLDRHLGTRPALVKALREAVGASQGTGEVHAIDAARLAPLVRAAAADWTVNPVPEISPDWARPAVGALRGFDQAVEEQLKALRAVVDAIRGRMPRGTRYSDTVTAVAKAVEAGEGHGFVRHPDLPGLKHRNAEAASVVSRDLEALETDLDRLGDDAGFEQRLAVAARSRGAGLGLMKWFLEENDAWLDAGLRQPAPNVAAEAADLLDRVQVVLRTWRGLSEGRSG